MTSAATIGNMFFNPVMYSQTVYNEIAFLSMLFQFSKNSFN